MNGLSHSILVTYSVEPPEVVQARLVILWVGI
jgi:hypothetical protein